MRPAFELAQLALPAAMIFLFSVWAGIACTRSTFASLALASLKCGAYLGYYLWGFDGTYSFLDDWSYLERGAVLHANGVGWFNLVENLPLLVATGEGNHFLYYLYNATAISWFGDGYYAPVALNVIAATAVAWLATRLVRAERLISPHHGPWFFAFLMLHPDVLAWSTVLNGKDTLVLLLHVVLLMAASAYLGGRRMVALLLAAPAVAALFFLRFYVPLLFAVALALTAAQTMDRRSRLRLLLVSSIALTALLIQMAPDLMFWFQLLMADFVNPLFGMLRFLLTPIPFNTDAAHSFLDLPATLHWLLLPTAAWGFARLVKTNSPFTRFLLMYMLVFATLYAMYGELQGPRHRLQLDFAWALCQFLGLVALLSGRRREPEHPDLKQPNGGVVAPLQT
jgi:hypothetical protein